MLVFIITIFHFLSQHERLGRFEAVEDSEALLSSEQLITIFFFNCTPITAICEVK